MTVENSERRLPFGVTVQTMEVGQAAIDNPTWQQENGTLLERNLAITASYGARRCGTLLAMLRIEKNDDGEIKDKYVYLGNIEVEGVRNIGVGSGLLNEMEMHARTFGASRIEGEISPDDLTATPHLPSFYEHRGYMLSPTEDGGFTITKLLQE